MEFLKELLDTETYAKVEEQLKDKEVKLANLKDGGYVNVEKYNTAVSDLETTRQELNSQKEQITKLSESSNASEGMKAELVELQEKMAKQEQEYQDKLVNNKKDAILERTALQKGAIDLVSVKAHLTSFLKDATLDESGDNVVGLDEQLSSLEEVQKHLFSSAPATQLKQGTKIKTLTQDEKLRQAMGL